MAGRTHPASCARCGAIVVDTLWSDHTVPLYACGSTPYSAVCGIRIDARLEDRNAAALEVADIDELAEILDLWAIAWAPTP